MSTQFAVDLVFRSQTKQLNDVQRKLNQLELNLRKLNQGKPFKPIEDGAEGAGRKVDKLKQRLGGLQGALASLGAGLALKASIGGAGQLAQTQLRLEALSEEYGEFGRIQKLVASNAKTFNQSQRESAEGFADVYARLRPLGIELDQIQTTYEGFNAVAIANGASAQAASAAFLQLSQALGSGRLQGDEFRSIAEQVPGILRLVADEMGVTVGELKQLGAEGKLTSDILIRSLAKGFDLNKDKIAKLLALSPAQKFKSFENAVSDLSNAVGKELLPAVIPMVKFLTEALRLFGKLPGPVKTLAAAVFGLAAAFVALAPAIKAVAGLLAGITGAGLLAAGPWIALAAGVGAVAIAAIDGTNKVRKFNDLVGTVGKDRAGITSRISEIEGRIESLGEKAQKGGRRALLAKKQIKELQGALANNKAALAALPPEKKPTIPTPDLPTPDPDKDSSSSAAKQLDNGAELLRQLQQSTALTETKGELDKEILGISQRYQDTLLDISKLEDQSLRGQLEEAAVRQRNAQINEVVTQRENERKKTLDGILQSMRDESELIGVTTEAGQRRVQLEQQIRQLQADGVIKTSAEADELRRQNEELEKKRQKMAQLTGAQREQNALYDQLAGTIAGGVGSAIDAVADSTKNLGEALQDIGRQILAAVGKMLIFYGLAQAFGALGGADGKGIFSYLAKAFGGDAEKLGFRAGGGPVSAGGSYIVGENGPELLQMNGDGSGYVHSNTSSAMSRYKPGAGSSGAGSGEAAGGGDSAANGIIKFESTVINGVEYVTRAEAEAIGTRAAQIGAKNGAAGGYAKTMSTMRNSRSTRARLGMG